MSHQQCCVYITIVQRFQWLITCWFCKRQTVRYKDRLTDLPRCWSSRSRSRCPRCRTRCCAAGPHRHRSQGPILESPPHWSLEHILKGYLSHKVFIDYTEKWLSGLQETCKSISWQSQSHFLFFQCFFLDSKAWNHQTQETQSFIPQAIRLPRLCSVPP